MMDEETTKVKSRHTGETSQFNSADLNKVASKSVKNIISESIKMVKAEYAVTNNTDKTYQIASDVDSVESYTSNKSGTVRDRLRRMSQLLKISRGRVSSSSVPSLSQDKSINLPRTPHAKCSIEIDDSQDDVPVFGHTNKQKQGNVHLARLRKMGDCLTDSIWRCVGGNTEAADSTRYEQSKEPRLEFANLLTMDDIKRTLVKPIKSSLMNKKKASFKSPPVMKATPSSPGSSMGTSGAKPPPAMKITPQTAKHIGKAPPEPTKTTTKPPETTKHNPKHPEPNKHNPKHPEPNKHSGKTPEPSKSHPTKPSGKTPEPNKAKEKTKDTGKDEKKANEKDKHAGKEKEERKQNKKKDKTTRTRRGSAKKGGGCCMCCCKCCKCCCCKEDVDEDSAFDSVVIQGDTKKADGGGTSHGPGGANAKRH